MTGQNIIAKARRILKDTTSVTEVGSFWSDEEILLALNMSQYIVVNALIDAKKSLFLSRLIKGAAYLFSSPGWQSLPLDYLHYASGTVTPFFGTSYGAECKNNTVTEFEIGKYDGSTSTPVEIPPNLASASNRMSRIYLGGEGAPYIGVSHYGIYIVGNDITASGKSGLMNGNKFVLFYYRKPTKIESSGDYLDFDDYIYENIIRHATVLLSFKETKTQRDVKNMKLVGKEISSLPSKSSVYLTNNDEGVALGKKEIG